MADNCRDLTFLGVVGDSFYFDDYVLDEVDTDSFEYSKTTQYLIRCPDNRFLILNEAKRFDRKDLNVQQQSSSDYKLNINIFRDLNNGSNRGRPVMLYASKGNKTYAAVCINDKEVVAQEVPVQELQRTIENRHHKALFYLVLDQPEKYKLRSSVYPQKFLGFDVTDSQKLVLCDSDPQNQEDTVQLQN